MGLHVVWVFRVVLIYVFVQKIELCYFVPNAVAYYPQSAWTITLNLQLNEAEQGTCCRLFNESITGTVYKFCQIFKSIINCTMPFCILRTFKLLALKARAHCFARTLVHMKISKFGLLLGLRYIIKLFENSSYSVIINFSLSKRT